MGTGPCVSFDRCEDSCGTLAHVPSGCSAACAHFAHTGRSALKARFLRMLRARRRVAQSPSGRAVAVGPICFPRAICAICALRASRRVNPLPTSAPLIEARMSRSAPRRRVAPLPARSAHSTRVGEKPCSPQSGRSAPRARSARSARAGGSLRSPSALHSPRALRARSARAGGSLRSPRVPADRFAPRARSASRARFARACG
jgi:hypothetical protein